jgi:hypothetical protein
MIGIWLLLYGVKLLSIIPDWETMYAGYPSYLPFFKYALYYGAVVLFILITYKFIAPLYTRDKNWLLFIVSILISIVGMAAAATYLKFTAYNLSLDWEGIGEDMIPRASVGIGAIAQEMGAALIHTFLGLGLKLGEEWYRFQQEKKELSVQKVESELAFLIQYAQQYLFIGIGEIGSNGTCNSEVIGHHEIHDL